MWMQSWMEIDLFINAYLKWIALGTGAKEEEA